MRTTFLKLLLEETNTLRASVGRWSPSTIVVATIAVGVGGVAGHFLGRAFLPVGGAAGLGAVRAGAAFFLATVLVQHVAAFHVLKTAPAGRAAESAEESVLRMLIRIAFGTAVAWVVLAASWSPLIRQLGTWPVLLGVELALGFALVAVGLNAMTVRLALEAAQRTEDGARVWVVLVRLVMLAVAVGYAVALWFRSEGNPGGLLGTSFVLSAALILLGVNRLSGLDASALKRLGLIVVAFGLSGLAGVEQATSSADSEEGVASYYADAFHGRTTASGEVFDMNAMTAAHRTLPFGTRVRVTNLVNDKSVELTINDRGPFVKGRIIDVSLEAARRLDFVREGVVRVRLEVLSMPEGSSPARFVRKSPFHGAVWAELYQSLDDDRDIEVLTLGVDTARRYVGLLDIIGGVHLFGADGVRTVEVENGYEDRVADTAGAGFVGAARVGPRIAFVQPFVEYGVGMVFTAREFPTGGTHWNFDKRQGLGALFRVSDRIDLGLGYRRLHVSNGKGFGHRRNPAYDAEGIFLELRKSKGRNR